MSLTPGPAAPPFDWSKMSSYLGPGRHWPAGYPDAIWDFFSPEDGEGMAQLLQDLIGSTSHSFVGNMYGYDFDPVNDILLRLAANPGVYFQLNLDKSQAGGVHEKDLLAKWSNGAIGTSIAIGQSSQHAISHLKVAIIDGETVVAGSTNWSVGGIEKQDNQLTVVRNPAVAAWYRTKLDIDHDVMLKAMKAVAA